MEQYDDSQMLLRQYLLGELDEDKQRQLEGQFLTNDQHFEELLVAEDELIDRYLGGALTARERERFDRHFLTTPERYQKLNFAGTLRRYISDAGVTESPASATDTARPASTKRFFPPLLWTQKPYLRFSFAAVVLLAVVGVSWLILKNWRQQNQSSRDSSHAVFTVALTPGLTRGTGEIKKIAVPDNVETVQLQLELALAEPQSYRASVETDEGRSVFGAGDLKPQMTDAGRVVILSVPAKLLTAGDYQVKLSELTAGGQLEDTGRYYFRVAGK